MLAICLGKNPQKIFFKKETLYKENLQLDCTNSVYDQLISRASW